MAESSGVKVLDDLWGDVSGALKRPPGRGKKKEGKEGPAPEWMAGRRPAPPRFWRWVNRNGWRLGPGLALGCLVVLRFGLRAFPVSDLVRGVANGVGSAFQRPHPLGASRFDSCWARSGGSVCGPSAHEALSLGKVFLVALFVAVFWWRASEVGAGGERAYHRLVRRMRRRRVLRGITDNWRSAVVQRKFVASPSRMQMVAIRLGAKPSAPVPQIELRDPRVAMDGSVVAEGRYRELADAYGFEKPKNMLSVITKLGYETGHHRRARVPRCVARRSWARHLRWLAPLAFPVVVAMGEKRYRLTPRTVFLGEHPLGGRYRTVRLSYPLLGAELLEADPEPAPDQSRIRVALGMDVIHWDRDKHPHLGIFGPTSGGKGHVIRRVAWQALQVGQLVCMIDGQGGTEHGIFRGLPNFWWFDPEAYRKEYGVAGLAPWVEESLSPDELGRLDEVPKVLNHQLAHLVYVRNQLQALVALGWTRNEVADRNFGTGWHEWPEHEQKAHPRVTVPIDETNTLLTKGGGPGKLGEDLRKEIGVLIGVLLFGGRKYGIHVALAAQILYSASWMARGMYAQLGFVVATGTLPPVHQLMVSQISGWPSYPDATGYGVAAAYANAPSIEPVRFPPAFQIEYVPYIRALLEAIGASAASEPSSAAD